jgi:hypothetical protein
MEMSQAALSGPLLLLVGGLLFVLLFGAIQQALKISSFFRGPSSYVIATCVSLLCMISLFRPFVRGKVVTRGGESGVVDFIMLPYAALAIAVLLVLLFLAFNRVFGASGYQVFREYAHRRGNAMDGSGLRTRTASKARRLAQVRQF